MRCNAFKLTLFSFLLLTLSAGLFILPKTSPAEGETANFPIYLYREPNLPISKEEYTGATVVSKEEEQLLLKMEEREQYGFLRQPAFREIKDRVTSYPQFDVTGDPNCPFEEKEVLSRLARGLQDKTPEYCYYLYTSYIHYPQNTGSPEVDRIIKAWADEKYDANNPYADACLITYVIGRSSPRYLSVAFCYQSFWRGTRIYRWWTIYNFDLDRGRALDLTDVFPDMERYAPLLEEYLHWRIYPTWLGAGLPFPLDMTIERLFLAPDGLYLIYNFSEQRMNADGINVAHIPLNDLELLGINMDLWKQ